MRVRDWMESIWSMNLGGQEAISPLGYGLNVPGILGVIAQCLPQLADCYAEAILKINKRIVLPKPIAKFLSADHFSGVFQKRDEEPIWLILQLYTGAVLQEFTGAGIDLKGTKLVDSSAT